MRLDHVSYACRPEHLADTVQRLGAALGRGFTDGGVHPRFGTRNFVLPLGGGTYLEVVAALDHPAVDGAPFRQAVVQRADAGGGWLGWVVAVDDLAPVEARLGRSAVPGHRRRPDGRDLSWRQIGVTNLIDDPQLPFFIQWEGDAAAGGPDHPSAGGAPDLQIAGLTLAGDPARVGAWLGQPADRLLDDVEVTWLDPASEDADRETGLCAVSFATPHGPVTLD